MIVYSATWCGPCKAYKQMLKANNIEFKTVDIDSDPEASRKANVRGVPTTVFPDGTVKVGALTLAQVKELNLRS